MAQCERTTGCAHELCMLEHDEATAEVPALLDSTRASVELSVYILFVYVQRSLTCAPVTKLRGWASITQRSIGGKQASSFSTHKHTNTRRSPESLCLSPCRPRCCPCCCCCSRILCRCRCAATAGCCCCCSSSAQAGGQPHSKRGTWRNGRIDVLQLAPIWARKMRCDRP
ncbi:hypothetical protein DUNSADRAFT_5289 [Dunaliella salina]|uniref:Encoded protein n=1 Tax=Dunaliella salina TaxID=3046 RepID=A0ABQ7GQL9_DUNSA|nr:hypothetical protein DUNSADRAFT_5289 [Dunaliella salina]|eukprot:KAF5836897.1 hypothetical protein DUNSADRAFT_5289 [Dunaliella salina]